MSVIDSIFWLVAVLLIAAVIYLGVASLTPRLSRAAHWGVTVIGILFAIPALLSAAYYLHFFDDLVWYYEFRALEFGELLACGLGILGGAFSGWSRRSETLRKSVGKLSIPLVVATMLAMPFLKPILMPLNLDSIGDKWSGTACLQTTKTTCGPCATAALLRLHGLVATEQELAAEARTSARSTEVWYLMRAMRKRGLNVHVEITSPQPATLPNQGLAGVRLGGSSGPGHFVAILSRQGDQYEIADPLHGTRLAPLSELQEQYYFTGFFTVTSMN